MTKYIKHFLYLCTVLYLLTALYYWQHWDKVVSCRIPKDTLLLMLADLGALLLFCHYLYWRKVE